MNPPHPENKTPLYYVGIGASAGGLEAIEQVFKHMPADTGLGFIVVQHLSPDYKSLMVELLSKHTLMPVVRAEENMQVLANSIYLIPPKKNLRIFHGHLTLSDQDSTKGINLPIDIFLHALADDQGEKSIAIILSGTGSDGMRGVRKIKECGGMVMVQNELSAKFDGMPKSAISTGLVDFILPAEDMPRQLSAFVKHPYAVEAEITDDNGLTRIFSLLREKIQVDFTYYKPSTVIRRIERRMTVNQVHNLQEYVYFLERFPGEVNNLYRELLIGVTSFMRDREAFELLGQELLPKLFDHFGNKTMRLWVAGCSTGEEAYSLAILCQECIERMGRHFDIKIFATDVDKNAIAHASNGVYPESIAADLSPRLLSKYFIRKEENFHIARNIREMVVFAQHNLVKDPPFTNIMLVSCRNLLIYLQPILQRKALELFNFSLIQEGILFLGTSETTGEMGDYFELLHHKWKLYKAKGKRQLVTGPDIVVPFDIKNRILTPRSNNATLMMRIHEEERILERLLKVFAEDYVNLAVVVNEQLELLYVVGDSEGFFKLPTGKMFNDITKMAGRDLAIPLATGLQKLFSSREEIKYSNIHLRRGDQIQLIQLRMKMLPEKKGQEILAVIFLEQNQPQIFTNAVSQSTPVTLYDAEREAEQRIQDLEQELQFTRENLQATVEELETSNEELQSTNEELLASNEELQSTNEELQSVNQELYTVNSEYHNKIIELGQANNDLDNLLKSTHLATLFLDDNLEIRRFTPDCARIFKIIDSDIGRPFHHLNHILKEIDLPKIARSVIESSHSLSREVESEDHHWYLLKVEPYQISPENYSGVVLTFIDIHDTKITSSNYVQQSEQLQAVHQALAQSHAEYLRSEATLKGIFRALSVAVGLIKERTIIWVNDYMEKLLGFSEIELAGQNTRQLYPDDEEYERVTSETSHQIQQHEKSSVKTIWIDKNGTHIPILLSTVSMTTDHLENGYIFTAINLNEINNLLVQESLSSPVLSPMLRQLNDPLLLCQCNGTIVDANPAALALCQTQPLTGQKIYDLLSELKPQDYQPDSDHAMLSEQTLSVQLMCNPDKPLKLHCQISSADLFPLRLTTPFFYCLLQSK